MIKKEVTFFCKEGSSCGMYDKQRLVTLNRDFEYHREGDLPSYREWEDYGLLECEVYFQNGKVHRQGGLPSERLWIEESLYQEGYYLQGELIKKLEFERFMS
jgi:hypothetical protein